MAKGKKTGGKDFAKGYQGGPGREPLPPEVRAIKKATRADMIRAFENVLSMNVAELGLIVSEEHMPNSNSLDAALAAIMLKAIKDGDPQRLSFMLDRVYGKPKEQGSEDGKHDHDDFLETIPIKALIQAAR